MNFIIKSSCVAIGLLFLACSAVAAPKRAVVRTVAQPTQGGVITGAGAYRDGDIITVSATANANWHFVQWNTGVTNRSFTFVVPRGTTTFTASFATNVVYGTLAVSAEPLNGGTVSGGGSYPVGKAVDITARPFTNWLFVRWQDNNTANPRPVIVPNGTLLMTATFLTNPPPIQPVLGSVQLDWSAVSGATRYVASWGIQTGVYTNSLMTTNTGDLRVRIEGLPTNQVYYFSVQAMDINGKYSPYSCEVWGRIGQTNFCSMGL